MALRLFVTRRAAREIARAARWWQEHRPAAHGAVRKDLKTTLDLLLLQPDIGAEVDEASSAGVRRFHLDRIRYWVYYRVRQDRFEILSVWHESRGEGPSI